jgi:hypothetical protein
MATTRAPVALSWLAPCTADASASPAPPAAVLAIPSVTTMASSGEPAAAAANPAPRLLVPPAASPAM